MSIEICITKEQLEKALEDVTLAHKNGFTHSLAVFRLTKVGGSITDCRADYSDLIPRASETNPGLMWGRFCGFWRTTRINKAGKAVRKS